MGVTHDLAGKICGGAKSAYARIAVTRFGIAFILLTCIHCFAQSGIQVALYRGDSGALSLLSKIESAADVPSNEISWLQRDGHDNYTMKLCTEIPLVQKGELSCNTVFQTSMETVVLEDAAVVARDLSVLVDEGRKRLSTRRAFEVDEITPSLNSTGHVDGVALSYNNGANSVVISKQCTQMLMYPTEIMNAYKIEDVALLGSQFWLLGISIIAILYRSIPQILAVLCSRVLATGWSAYSVWHTKDYESIFFRLLVTSDTPCHFDFFPTLFGTRTALAISNLVLNFTALLFTALLGRHLIKTFSAFTFQRVGPPPEIVRIYRLFLAVFVLLQLCVFFLVTAIGLWLTWLTQGPLGRISSHTALYDGLFIFTIVTLIPWIAMGWYAVRRELKTTMVIFLFICFVYIVCWSIMFYSEVYRWTFLEWMFFACLTVVSFVVLIATGVFGVICRLNFGKGLAEYLHAEAVLAEADFTPELFPHEKASRIPIINSSGYSLPFRNTLKHDINWDPFDLERPPIIAIMQQNELSYPSR